MRSGLSWAEVMVGQRSVWRGEEGREGLETQRDLERGRGWERVGMRSKGEREGETETKRTVIHLVSLTWNFLLSALVSIGVGPSPLSRLLLLLELCSVPFGLLQREKCGHERQR